MRIGIVAQEHGEIFGVHQDYLTLVERFGTPIILPPMDWKTFVKTVNIDGLLLPGGSDVDSKRYSIIPSFLSYRPNQYLEYFDTEILPNLIGPNFPIFGICRGLQTLNVVLGGTLFQHLWRHPQSKHKTDLVHEIKFSASNKIVRVNSFHHQCVRFLAKSLIAVAKSPDGIVEAAEHEEYPIVGVQWHPERIHDEWSLGVMEKLFS